MQSEETSWLVIQILFDKLEKSAYMPFLITTSRHRAIPIILKSEPHEKRVYYLR